MEALRRRNRQVVYMYISRCSYNAYISIHPFTRSLEEFRSTLPELFNDYAKYKAHVCRQKYEDPAIWKARQDETEMAWKTQYESSAELIDTPEYLKRACAGRHARKKGCYTFNSYRSDIRSEVVKILFGPCATPAGDAAEPCSCME